MQMNGPEGYELARKKSLAVSAACVAINWPNPGFKGRTFQLCLQLPTAGERGGGGEVSKERRKEQGTFPSSAFVSKETGSKKCESECCQWDFLFFLRPSRGFAFLSLLVLRWDTMDVEKIFPLQITQGNPVSSFELWSMSGYTFTLFRVMTEILTF